MIPATAEHVWVSRLRTGNFTDHFGFQPDPGNEIPHLRGIPVPTVLPDGAVVVTEWPNLAGRLEPSTGSNIVRWSRSLAPEPPNGSIIAFDETVEPRLLADMRAWLGKFARSLMQIPGVSIATPSESPRIIILTPRGVRHAAGLPIGMVSVPRRLTEFPGGVILTMDRQSFDQRSEYADTVRGIIEEA